MASTPFDSALEKIKDYIDNHNYVHKQLSASAVWNIAHNLNKYPSVTVVDSSGNIVFGEVKYIDENNVTVTFSSEFAGKAFLN